MSKPLTQYAQKFNKDHPITATLMRAFAKAEPNHSITKNPVSYVATFSEMAEAVANLFNKSAWPPKHKHKLKADLITELVEAVKALPVEEMIEQGPNGELTLLGYCMQAQGEWDRVCKALEAVSKEQT